MLERPIDIGYEARAAKRRAMMCKAFALAVAAALGAGIPTYFVLEIPGDKRHNLYVAKRDAALENLKRLPQIEVEQIKQAIALEDQQDKQGAILWRNKIQIPGSAFMGLLAAASVWMFNYPPRGSVINRRNRRRANAPGLR